MRSSFVYIVEIYQRLVSGKGGRGTLKLASQQRLGFYVVKVSFL